MFFLTCMTFSDVVVVSSRHDLKLKGGGDKVKSNPTLYCLA